MEKTNERKNYLVIFFIGILVGMLIYMVIPSESETITIYEEKQQPMLMVEFLEWGENIDDGSESLFDYWISNYGNVEAKNVVINCMVQDKDDNILKQQSFNIGNIASNSYEWQESIMKYHINNYDNVYGICKLESANGEYLNLYDRLSELD